MINDYTKYIDWDFPATVVASRAFLEATELAPFAAEILLRRGITSPAAARAFLYPAYYSPALPDALPAMDVAIRVIEDAIARGDRILIWGDFDVDGQTAVAVLREAQEIFPSTIVPRDLEQYRVTRGHVELVEPEYPPPTAGAEAGWRTS